MLHKWARSAKAEHRDFGGGLYPHRSRKVELPLIEVGVLDLDKSYSKIWAGKKAAFTGSNAIDSYIAAPYFADTEPADDEN
jgi:hypothetical protein